METHHSTGIDSTDHISFTLPTFSTLVHHSSRQSHYSRGSVSIFEGYADGALSSKRPKFPMPTPAGITATPQRHEQENCSPLPLLPLPLAIVDPEFCAAAAAYVATGTMTLEAVVTPLVIIIDEAIGMVAKGVPAATLVDMVIMAIVEEAMKALSDIAKTAVEAPSGDDDAVPFCCMAMVSHMAWVLLAMGLMLKTIPLPQSPFDGNKTLLINPTINNTLGNIANKDL